MGQNYFNTLPLRLQLEELGQFPLPNKVFGHAAVPSFFSQVDVRVPITDGADLHVTESNSNFSIINIKG